MKAFHLRLKEIRLDRGWTQAEAAHKLGISETGYAGWEQDYREPDIKSIIKLCQIFEVSADYLLGLTDY